MVIRVGITGARKGADLARSFERRGATAVHAPTLAGDVPAPDDAVVEAIDRLAARPPDWFAASTGMGMRLLVDVAERTGRRSELDAVLRHATAVARGAKARGALQRIGHPPAFVAPGEVDEEVVAWLTGRVHPGQTVAVQVHGAGRHPYRALIDHGVDLQMVQTYVSAPLPDPERAETLVRAVAAGDLDVVTFTSPGAVHGLFDLAETLGIAGDVQAAMDGDVAVAAVGHVTAAAVAEHGASVTLVPDEPRSGALVRAVMAWHDARTNQAR